MNKRLGEKKCRKFFACSLHNLFIYIYLHNNYTHWHMSVIFLDWRPLTCLQTWLTKLNKNIFFFLNETRVWDSNTWHYLYAKLYRRLMLYNCKKMTLLLSLLYLRYEPMLFWPNFSTTIHKRLLPRLESFEKNCASNFSARNLSPSNRKCSSRVKSRSCSSIRSNNQKINSTFFPSIW